MPNDRHTLGTQFQRDALAQEGMEADAGGEPVVAIGIFVRLFAPKITIEQGVDIDATTQWLER